LYLSISQAGTILYQVEKNPAGHGKAGISHLEGWALSHKSAEFVISRTLGQLRHGRRHSRGRAQPSEPIEDRSADLQFGNFVVEVTRHDTFTEQLKATHLGLDKAAPVIAAPLLPDFLAKPARVREDGVTALAQNAGPFMAWRSCE
jgi:hypothetical protein